MTQERTEDVRWQQVGGHFVLDLVNTVSWRLDPTRRRDLLTTPERVRDWAAVHLPDLPWAARPATEQTKASVVEIRGHLIAILDAHSNRARLPVERSQALLVIASQYIASSAGPAKLPFEPVPARITDVSLGGFLALAALDLLRGSQLDRIRRCAGADCGWFFLDQTKNSSRRWCQATGCGNLARVRRYSAKRQASVVRPAGEVEFGP